MTKYTKEQLNYKLNAWKKDIENGTSKIFYEWNAYTGCSKEDFIKELEWLFDDPQDGKTKNRNPYRRETYCYPDGTFHRFIRIYYEDGTVRRARLEDYKPTGVFMTSEPMWHSGLCIFDPVKKCTESDKKEIDAAAKSWRGKAKMWRVI